MGACIGVLGAFILFWFFKLELNSILFIAAIIGFFAVVPLLFVKEKKTVAFPKMRLRIGLKNLPLHCKRYLLAATLFALGNFTYMSFILKSKFAFESIKSKITELLVKGEKKFRYLK